MVLTFVVRRRGGGRGPGHRTIARPPLLDGDRLGGSGISQRRIGGGEGPGLVREAAEQLLAQGERLGHLAPGGEAWLPVLHTARGGRHYTALFSNTPRAHEMRTTRDWVVLYYDGAGGERQCTVITSRIGPLTGRRIVRGREIECERYYRRESRRPGDAAGSVVLGEVRSEDVGMTSAATGSDFVRVRDMSCSGRLSRHRRRSHR